MRDQDKRLLAYVYIGELSVNEEMIRQGQAVLYTVLPNVTHVDEYRKAQGEAKKAGRGIWDSEQPLDAHPGCFTGSNGAGRSADAHEALVLSLNGFRLR